MHLHRIPMPWNGTVEEIECPGGYQHGQLLEMEDERNGFLEPQRASGYSRPALKPGSVCAEQTPSSYPEAKDDRNGGDRWLMEDAE